MREMKYVGCSQGYFGVPPEINEWPLEKAKQFLWEMYTQGGRIGVERYRSLMSGLTNKQGGY